MALHELINTYLDSMSPRPQKILDVGGGALPHSAATEILDLFDHNFAQRFSYDRDRSRVDGQKWTTFDVCSRQMWPYRDDEFDFSICAHTLEDLKDPLWVCNELARVSRAGYIEFPSRFQESINGLVRRGITGWPHHRWMITTCGESLLLIPKLHHVNAFPYLCLPTSFRKQSDAKHTSFFWSNRFSAYELLVYVEDFQREYISQFDSSRTPWFHFRRWLSKIVPREHSSAKTPPGYVWTDTSGRKFGPYTSSDKGPWLKTTLS